MDPDRPMREVALQAPPAPAVVARALAVERVARLGVGRGLCLVRSLALMDLLDRDGLSGGRIRIGVRRARGVFEAHAWVEWKGSVIGDDPLYVGTFLPLSGSEGMPGDLSWASAPPSRSGIQGGRGS